MKKFLKSIDLQDVMLCVGSALLVAGIAAIYRPAGAIVAGVLLMADAYLIERAKSLAPAQKKKES